MSSALKSISRDETVRTRCDDVLDNYAKSETQELYKKLVKLTMEECEELLKNINGKDNKKKGVKGVVQGRTKEHESLEEKLNILKNLKEKPKYMNTEEYDWLEEKLTRLENNNKDPKEDEILKKELKHLKEDPTKNPEDYDWLEKRLTDLENNFNKGPDPKEYEFWQKKLTELEKDPNEAPNFREWVSNDENNIYEHPEMGDLAGVRIGLYLPGDVPRVAQKIEEHFDRKWLFGTVTGGRDTIKGRNISIKKHMNGQWYSRGPDGTDKHWEHYGYKSWQVVVEWKEPLAERFQLLRREINKVGLNSLRVEIQVGTVVTQAWAEVQHNIIYKDPDNIDTTPTIERIIDAVNDMVITTDIMLKELEKGVEDAKKEAEEAGNKRFNDGYDFLHWFKITYLNRMREEERKLWASNTNTAHILINLYSRRACPSFFKYPIERHGLLRTKLPKANRYDISVLLLEDMGNISSVPLKYKKFLSGRRMRNTAELNYRDSTG
ncbi:MAG: hypothetical protein Q9187_005185 [Circinaria calcarea]